MPEPAPEVTVRRPNVTRAAFDQFAALAPDQSFQTLVLLASGLTARRTKSGAYHASAGRFRLVFLPRPNADGSSRPRGWRLVAVYLEGSQ